MSWSDPNIIANIISAVMATISTLGAVYIAYLLTTSNKTIIKKVKLETRERMQVENIMEIFKALSKFSSELNYMQSLITVLAKMLITRSVGEKIEENSVSLDFLEGIASQMNASEDMRHMLIIANNQLGQYCAGLPEAGNDLLALFKTNKAISDDHEEQDKMSRKIRSIHAKIHNIFLFERGLTEADITMRLKKIIQEHEYHGNYMRTKLLIEVADITSELIDIYNKKYSPNP